MKDFMKTISVFGLGYVGVVTAACFAKEGHNVMGVDISKEKVEMLNNGISPIIEDKIEDLVKQAVSSGRFSSSIDHNNAVQNSDFIFICVGTPSRKNGSLDTSFIERVCENIGQTLQTTKHKPTIVVRSTLLPGSMEKIVIPTLERASSNSIEEIADVLFNPEFLREGSAVNDFFNPPKIVIGESQKGSGDKLMDLYSRLVAPRFIVNYKVSEMVKYCDNMFHALKVTFANEVGHFCLEMGIDSQKVMDIFVSDEKLNISKKYLRPGFAFGGACLPKDLRAFNYNEIGRAHV